MAKCSRASSRRRPQPVKDDVWSIDRSTPEPLLWRADVMSPAVSDAHAVEARLT